MITEEEQQILAGSGKIEPQRYTEKKELIVDAEKADCRKES